MLIEGEENFNAREKREAEALAEENKDAKVVTNEEEKVGLKPKETQEIQEVKNKPENKAWKLYSPNDVNYFKSVSRHCFYIYYFIIIIVIV